MRSEEHGVNVENKYDNDDSKFVIIIITVIIYTLTLTTATNVLN
jgi:hypothetical protein